MKNQEYTNVTLRVPLKLKEEYEGLAAYDHRSLNAEVTLALSDWLHMREELHPQFVKEINAAMKEAKEGKSEDVWRG